MILVQIVKTQNPEEKLIKDGIFFSQERLVDTNKQDIFAHAKM